LYAGQLKLFQIARLLSNGEAWERLAGGGFKIKHLLGWPARLPSIECGGAWPAGSLKFLPSEWFFFVERQLYARVRERTTEVTTRATANDANAAEDVATLNR
jgi:hypothetical protein